MLFRSCESTGAGSDAADCGVLSEDYLAAYREGSHHTDGPGGSASVKMDYDTQTKSEFFELEGLTGEIKWQSEDTNGLTDGFTWKTSREYLIDNGICTTTKCLEYDRTSSLELQWANLASADAAAVLIDSIEAMHLHLSDEARGLPVITTVPLPAAAYLFISALAGLVVAKRKQLKEIGRAHV